MSAPGSFRWSLRRELWEHRAVYVAPLIMAAVVLTGFFFHLGRIAVLPAVDPAKRAHVAGLPYSIAASAILFTSFVVAAFYCLDALQGERRDRSILFWKSMPVSDFTTVAAKATVPLAVLPLLATALAFVTQLVMLVIVSGVLSAKGLDASHPWSAFPLPRMTLVMLYGVAVHVLWYVPLYGWAFLVSAWTRRATFLWAILPFLAIAVVEGITLGSSWFVSAIRYRLLGAMTEAFAVDALKTPVTQLHQLEPARFFASPNLWLGIAFGVACFYGAVRLRRYREPN